MEIADVRDIWHLRLNLRRISWRSYFNDTLLEFCLDYYFFFLNISSKFFFLILFSLLNEKKDCRINWSGSLSRQTWKKLSNEQFEVTFLAACCRAVLDSSVMDSIIVLCPSLCSFIELVDQMEKCLTNGLTLNQCQFKFWRNRQSLFLSSTFLCSN